MDKSLKRKLMLNTIVLTLILGITATAQLLHGETLMGTVGALATIFLIGDSVQLSKIEVK